MSLTSEEIDQLATEVVTRIKDQEDDHKLLWHLGVAELGSPAIVTNPNLAAASPCTCFKYDGEDYCWSRGMIGLLGQDEEEKYCKVGKVYKEQPGITERYEKFSEAAKEAHKEIEDIPKGERLDPWLEAMGRELSKRGIDV